ncbi:hypothetical protein SBV1_270043 [Verrucomicrobia bacterium]|nr:hypothetical protein SBV1_270043 [Verrucomicrobiota bacterium]
MNDREHQDEENLARLIRAGFNETARPDATMHQQTLRRLQEICRTEYGSQPQEQSVSAKAPKADSVSRRVRHERNEYERNTYQERTTIMSKLFTRWGFGLSAAAAAAAILVIAMLASPHAQAAAAEVMAKGAKALAKLTSVHLRGRLRTEPQDNFSMISAASDFQTIELWKQFEPELKWRAEKPARVAVMDGNSTLLYIKSGNLALKVPHPAPSAFDTGWLHLFANLSAAITNELNNALAKGWSMSLNRQTGADGLTKAVVTIQTKAGLPFNDYLKDTSFDRSDTRRVYQFDDQTGLLEAVHIYLEASTGETLMFKLDQIEYNEPIDPSVFQLELPTNVIWWQDEMPMLPDNQKYAAMTPEQAAQAYFDAFARKDWAEAEKFRRSAVDEGTKQEVGGLQVISIGQSFHSADQNYPGLFVPYEIKLANGEVLKHHIALKKDAKTGRWWVDGGGF